MIAIAIVHTGPVLDILEEATGYRPDSATMTLAGGPTRRRARLRGRSAGSKDGPATAQPPGPPGTIGRPSSLLGVPTGQPSYKR